MADGVSAIRLVGAAALGPAEAPTQPHAAARTPKPKPGARDAEPEAARPPMQLRGALRRELRPGADTALDHHIGPDREVAWSIVPARAR